MYLQLQVLSISVFVYSMKVSLLAACLALLAMALGDQNEPWEEDYHGRRVTQEGAPAVEELVEAEAYMGVGVDMSSMVSKDCDVRLSGFGMDQYYTDVLLDLDRNYPFCGTSKGRNMYCREKIHEEEPVVKLSYGLADVTKKVNGWWLEYLKPGSTYFPLARCITAACQATPLSLTHT